MGYHTMNYQYKIQWITAKNNDIVIIWNNKKDKYVDFHYSAYYILDNQILLYTIIEFRLTLYIANEFSDIKST